MLTISYEEKQWLAGQKSSTYKFLLPPQLMVADQKIRVPFFQIDVPKLGVQVAVVAVITGGLFVTLKEKKKN